ncbi:MAG: hypothetical protein JWM80_270 [Cyanobacteria bacterium RYN_339]|nr:hypothetical protein [Cyanobacteria bacterium RYN_339]
MGAWGMIDNAHFNALVERYHAARFERRPTYATSLGLHAHDHRLEDFSLSAVPGEVAELEDFRDALAAIAPPTLDTALAADRTWLLAVIDGELQGLTELRPLERDPDYYSSQITASAFSLINRAFAPPEVRAAALLSRLALMPAALEHARANLANPARVLTEIALDQLAGNRSFFRQDVPAAFAGCALQAEVAAACSRVDESLAEYGRFLADELLPRSTGEFAIGEAAYRRKLYADELLDVPLERLRALGEADLRRNQAALQAAAAEIDPLAPLAEVLGRLAATHVAPEALLDTTWQLLDGVKAFVQERGLLAIPDGPPLHVVETPPFMRATTSAAMDTPGPFETAGTDAYFYVTLPNPAWSAAERESYMGQWTRPLIANLAVHEAYPGHYVQFLRMADFPTASRRVLWSPSNVEGWAHYCEQMMWEEGFGADDPWHRVAQLQDALLRNARLVVGLALHTGGMTLEAARSFFEQEAYLSPPTAKAEAWRGASDPTYGYYTLGKLMLLQLRDDLRARQGDAFKLADFHDAFVRLGPLPLPLVREALVGERGEPLLALA